MEDDLILKIFISYAGKGREVWEPLVYLIKELYHCKVIWGQEEVPNYRDSETMMQEMVKTSDVALFLLTHDSEGVFHEMELWYKYNSSKFVNALLLKDSSIPPETIKRKAGFDAAFLTFSSDAPWKDVHYIFPAIHKFLKAELLSLKKPSWEREYNRIIHKYNLKTTTDNFPVNRIRSLFKLIAGNPRYKDPEQWSFRVNWHMEVPEVDSYSGPVNCLRLLEALLQTDANRQEYEFVFGAIKRLVRASDNDEPPKKLSGNILFSGCSISTLEGIQVILGNYPYEKQTAITRKRALYAHKVPDIPQALLLPKELLIQDDNYERFINSQRLILNAVSKICKYVLCSTVEITASHSFLLSSGNSAEGPKLAMSCTATRTNKDTLAAVAEVPIITEDNQNIVWYGQPYKKPSSEYRPHWLYHNRDKTGRVAKNLILHFHPIPLVEIYRVYEDEGIHIDREELIDEIASYFRGKYIDFHVFEEYPKYSSRDIEFGAFMRDKIKDEAIDYSVIWKPNHGLWVFLDDRTCNDDKLVDTLLALDSISQRAAASIRR